MFFFLVMFNKRQLGLLAVEVYVSLSISTFTVAIPTDTIYVEALQSESYVAASIIGMTAIVTGILNIPLVLCLNVFEREGDGLADRDRELATVAHVRSGVSLQVAPALVMGSGAQRLHRIAVAGRAVRAQRVELEARGGIVHDAPESCDHRRVLQRRCRRGPCLVVDARDSQDDVFNEFTAATWLLLVACVLFTIRSADSRVPGARAKVHRFQDRAGCPLQFCEAQPHPKCRDAHARDVGRSRAGSFREVGVSRRSTGACSALPVSLLHVPKLFAKSHRITCLGGAVCTVGALFQLGSSVRAADIALFTIGSILHLSFSQVNRGLIWGEMVALSETSIPR